MELQEIIKAQAQFTIDSKFYVGVNTYFQKVYIQSTENDEDNIFLEGHKADEFISLADSICEDIHIDIETAYLSVAKNYIESI